MLSWGLQIPVTRVVTNLQIPVTQVVTNLQIPVTRVVTNGQIPVTQVVANRKKESLSMQELRNPRQIFTIQV